LGDVVADLVQGDALMTDAHDHSDGRELAVTETLEKAAAERKAAEQQAFAKKLAKRPPPNPVERAEIEKARKRTKARAPSIVMHVEDGTAGSVWKGSRVVASAGPRGYCGARGRERDLRLNQSCRSWSGSESRTLRPAVIEAIIRNESSAGGAASAK
jgi:hypothetical protein